MKFILSALASTRTMLVLLIIFTLSIATATFVENDFGNDAARKLIYNARWFEVLMFLGMINIVFIVVKHKLYKWNKLTLFVFHIAFAIIILGAGITRYFGREGIMHIREGQTSGNWITVDPYLEVVLEKDGIKKYRNFPVLFSEVSGNRFRKKISFENHKIKIRVKEFIPHSGKDIEYSPDGSALIHLVTSGEEGRKEIIISGGENIKAGKVLMHFSSSAQEKTFADSVVLADKDGTLTFKAPFPVVRTSMNEGITDTLKANLRHSFVPFQLHYFQGIPFVLKNYLPLGQIVAKPSPVANSDLPSAVKTEVEMNGQKITLFAWGQKGQFGNFEYKSIDGVTIGVRYGAVRKKLPFSLRLNDFIIKRYPGSESPSWFESNVQLLDPQKETDREERIYMNHILKHRGYRFYQSSYDSDEQGTVLSLNCDGLGTTISYIGYLLMALGMLLSLLNRKSRFRKLAIDSSSVGRLMKTVVVFLFFVCSSASGQTGLDSLPVIASDHAGDFGKILVQDNGGRIEPVHTLASEVLRKISRKEIHKGQSANQVFIGMTVFPERWQQESLIKAGHPEIQKLLGLQSKYASFLDFFPAENQGNYLIRPEVEEAYRKKPAYRNKFDNEIIRVDERVNICYLIYHGTLLKIFPAPGDSSNTWHSFVSAPAAFQDEDSLFTRQILNYYIEQTRKSVQTGDWNNPAEIVKAIKIFQDNYGQAVIPSVARLKAESFYNASNIFQRITRIYLLIGCILLIVQFLHIFLPRFQIKYISIPAVVFIAVVFLLHTFGLGLRWYVAGHAPWSNGYEALTFIAWATVLAGLLFSRKSGITISATAILAALILQTAHLSWMDPQITNLVPVLKSYWLIVHVAVITASYGFLGLGALVALVNLLLLFFESGKNMGKLEPHITRLTRIIEMTLIAGLYLLSIGTFLGGVWANESWGRYWAWDPKETWALVTVVVYAVILHLRLVPGLKGRVLFNILSLIGFASVIMTYFGVNYYLSGLHSYAQGDPLPVPPMVYYTVAVVLVLSTLAVLNQIRLTRVHTDKPNDK